MSCSLLIIDNYDSFTFNLYQYLGELGVKSKVIKNNQLSLAKIQSLNPKKIIISPGPGSPERDQDFGVCQQVIKTLGVTTPLLGVCLGHQGIGVTFGGKVVNAPTIFHGKRSQINHHSQGLFAGIESPMEVMRYHSLVLDWDSLPTCLEVTAVEPEDNLIMGISHREYPIYGIQFHPESIGTLLGKQLLENFLLISH